MSNNIGRNDPCPCGSLKKFKKCCLLKEEQMQADSLALRKEFQATMDAEWDTWFAKDQAVGQKNMSEATANPQPVYNGPMGIFEGMYEEDKA
jgi:hypothetical protein